MAQYGQRVKEPWLAAAHAGTCRSRGPPAGSRLPLWAQEERPRRVGAKARLKRRSGGCLNVQSRQCHCCSPPRRPARHIRQPARAARGDYCTEHAVLTAYTVLHEVITAPHCYYLGAAADAARHRPDCDDSVDRRRAQRCRARAALPRVVAGSVAVTVWVGVGHPHRVMRS